MSGTWWTNGISLYNASNTVIDKVHISGNKNVTQQGITWAAAAAPPPSEAATGLEMSNLEVKWCNSALLTSGHVEGIYVTGFEFISCGRSGLPAVYLYASQGGGAGEIGGAAAHFVNGQIDFRRERANAAKFYPRQNIQCFLQAYGFGGSGRHHAGLEQCH